MVDAADFLIGAGYSRSDVLTMTPREIMFAEQPARQRKDREKADALVIAALGSNDPNQAIEISEGLL